MTATDPDCGITGTPTFLSDGQRHEGGHDRPSLMGAIAVAERARSQP